MHDPLSDAVRWCYNCGSPWSGRAHRSTVRYDLQASSCISVIANLLKDIIDGQRMVVHLDGTLDDTLSQTHIHIRVVDNRISHQRVHHTFQVTHATIGRFCNILDHLCRNLQTVTTALRIQDIHTQLHIGLFKFGNETAGETCQQTILHTLQIHWGTIAGKNDLLAATEKMIEDMEEGVKRLRRVHPLLDIIDDQHVNRLIEGDEVVGGVMTD